MKPNSQKISPAIMAAHETAARSLAGSYIKDLRALVIEDKAGLVKFGTLAERASLFRHMISDLTLTAASARKVSRCSVRHDLIVTLAKTEIKTALLCDPSLMARLNAVREEQAKISAKEYRERLELLDARIEAATA